MSIILSHLCGIDGYTLFCYYVNVNATVICRCMGNVKWLAPIAVNTLPTVHHQEITNQVASRISFSLITNATGDNEDCRDAKVCTLCERVHF